MTEKKYYAHSLLGKKPEAGWQSLEEHLKNVAELASNFAEPFEAGKWAYLAGLLHDIGKYSIDFQVRLLQSSDNDENSEMKPGKVDHSTAGAQKANELFPNGMGKLVAYAIAGHHSGMPDGKSNDSCLRSRLIKNVPDYSACSTILSEYVNTIRNLPFYPISSRAHFQIATFVRMIFSCLVDADFLDTEKFMNKKKSCKRGTYPSLTNINLKLVRRLEKLTINSKPTEVNKHRANVLRQCQEAAEWMPGLFSLTVPTGGGKTLSSLAFALKHALKYGMQRVIYVIPYTSIIEQNADVFRDVLGDDAVLEHHSNFEPKVDDFRSQLASENWDASLVVTTNVQFFESLFSSRVSRCRKLHNIANSVIVLDEAQMLPVSLLKPCMEILKELADVYKSTIVLCSATQPALVKSNEFEHGLEGIREIIQDPCRLYNQLKRVKITYLSALKDTELVERLSTYSQVLCVVNTRRQARQIYELANKGGAWYHLSALMCPAHRTKVIARIKWALENNEPCRVVSTQLVEAGVDIDFPVVFRSAAGIDSIAQAAGRCNREGKLGQNGQVFVFHPEHGLPVGYLRQNAEVAEGVMRNHEDLLSMEAVTEYFKRLYWRHQDKLDSKNILESLKEGVAQADFPFKDINEKFKIIDNAMESIIIPWDDDAKDIVRQIRYVEFPHGLARKAQRFCVQVYPNVLKKLEGVAVERIQERYCVLANVDIYRQDIGLDYDDPIFRNAESNIC